MTGVRMVGRPRARFTAWRGGPRRALLAGLVALLALLGACQQAARPAAPAPQAGTSPVAPAASPATPTDITFRFSFLDLGYNAPFYLAEERGYYRDASLNVTFQEGRGGDTTLKLIANGSNDLGMSDAGVVLRGVSQGMPIQVIAASMRKHPMALMFQKGAPIQKPADLVGKTVAIPTGSAQSQLFPAFLRLNSVDPSAVRELSVDVAVAPTAMLEGRADAYVAWYSTSPPVINGQADYLAWADYGFNSLAEVMVGNTGFLQKNADAVRRFVAASQRGWREATATPDAAVDAQLKLAPNNFSREIISGALVATLKNVDGPNTQGKPWGEMVDIDWQTTRDLLVEYAELDPKVDLAGAWTNAYVPKS
jgi:NitT/TauT family transport system substrate-binding protein